MKVTLDYIIKFLKTVQAEKPGWKELFEDYNKYSGYHEYGQFGFEIEFILDSLRDELEWYQPNPKWRKKDSILFGEEKLLHIVNQVLEDLKELGIDVDKY